MFKQSNFIGASVNAVNTFRDQRISGSAYSYELTKTFKGTKVVDATFTKTLPASYKMVGLRLDGPIIKNKLFFLLIMERRKGVRVPPELQLRTSGSANYTNNIARPYCSNDGLDQQIPA